LATHDHMLQLLRALQHEQSEGYIFAWF